MWMLYCGRSYICGHERWVSDWKNEIIDSSCFMNESWIFLQSVSGPNLKERMQSLDTQKHLAVEPQLLYVKKQRAS